jgi:hypothetical protein
MGTVFESCRNRNNLKVLRQYICELGKPSVKLGVLFISACVFRHNGMTGI